MLHATLVLKNILMLDLVLEECASTIIRFLVLIQANTLWN